MVFRKILSVLRWFSVLLLWVVFFGIPSYFLFWISYIFKKQLYNLHQDKPFKWYKFITWYFWIFLGGPEKGLYGPDWWREHHNIDMSKWHHRFYAAYRFTGIRNFAWTFHEYFHPKIGEKVIISQKGKLTKNGNPTDLMVFPDIQMVNELGEWKDNTSTYLSLKYSTLGWCWNWYEIDGTLYFRGGFAKHIRGNWWMEFNMGVQDQSWTDKTWYVLSMVQKFKKVYEEL